MFPAKPISLGIREPGGIGRDAQNTAAIFAGGIQITSDLATGVLKTQGYLYHCDTVHQHGAPFSGVNMYAVTIF